MSETRIKKNLREGRYFEALGVSSTAGNSEIVIALVKARNSYPRLQDLFIKAQNDLIIKRDMYDKTISLCSAAQRILVRNHGEEVLSLLEKCDQTIFNLVKSEEANDSQTVVDSIKRKYIDTLSSLQIFSSHITEGKVKMIDTRKNICIFIIPPNVKTDWIVCGNASDGNNVYYAKIAEIKQATPTLSDTSLDLDDLFDNINQNIPPELKQAFDNLPSDVRDEIMADLNKKLFPSYPSYHEPWYMKVYNWLWDRIDKYF